MSHDRSRFATPDQLQDATSEPIAYALAWDGIFTRVGLIMAVVISFALAAPACIDSAVVEPEQFRKYIYTITRRISPAHMRFIAHVF